MWSENIDYGNKPPRDVILSLLIDDGVLNRGHRHAMFGTLFKTMGAATGNHPVYRQSTVIDYNG